MENNYVRNFKNVEVNMNPYQILNDKDFIFFTTQTFALKMQLNMSAASHQLKRMGGRGNDKCSGLDSNQHGFPHTPLKRTCLPNSTTRAKI